MPFTNTNIEGLLLYEPRVFEDTRGCFFEAYNQAAFAEAGISYHFIQDNQSHSSYGVIRGLHYQLNPHAQCKLVRVLEGSILDVAVDVRKQSPTYGRVFTVELSSANKKQLLVPHGFAHGFSVLSAGATVLYKCDAFYHRESEGGILYNDPDLAINWHIPEAEQIISEKDRLLPAFKDALNNF
ncbi:dTDP-4-dehydrorhamnose 3,5-epimerase [Niabella drilacis]|uniref:dTDP-4-dehydrorhamnose 3,5-epimerase n=1 Tax=Niabella drilacis (strain DSM 25811 / CCM 8410 / CCUG 62505 / LMG 26954 / E90) TaxID=1285928 RepID=A0A1G6UZK3_NIADE|nr:dTDP-4-dehydrorhamnose 3,5-epimerase [Niabella drilacis]SDD46769.1 dTDP-4-dehydrorhamnose 3,5-epimerase [Niabella drilacis]